MTTDDKLEAALKQAIIVLDYLLNPTLADPEFEELAEARLLLALEYHRLYHD